MNTEMIVESAILSYVKRHGVRWIDVMIDEMIWPITRRVEDGYELNDDLIEAYLLKKV